MKNEEKTGALASVFSLTIVHSHLLQGYQTFPCRYLIPPLPAVTMPFPALWRVSSATFICLILGVSPFLSFHFWLDTGFHNKQRILQAICLTLISMVAMYRFARQKRLSFHVDRITTSSLAFFFLFGVLSSASAYSQRHAFWEWSSFLLLLILAWTIATEISNASEACLEFIFVISGISCGFYLFNVALIYGAVLTVGAQPYPESFIFGFDNFRFFNHTQTITLPILCLLALRSAHSSKQYRFWFSIASLWWAMLFVAAGRGTFVGVIAGVAATWFLRRSHAIPWIRMIAWACIAGFVFYLVIFALIPLCLGFEPFGFMPQVIQRTAANPTSSRWPLWRFAWDMISSHPWLGGGPLHFAHYGRIEQFAAHPHNWILQIASEWGVPALICLVVAIGSGGRALVGISAIIRPADQVNQATLSAWLTIGVAIVVDGLVSGLIVMPTSQLWIALYLGCAWGWTLNVSSISGQSPQSVTHGTQNPYGIVAAIVALLVIFWAGLLPDIGKLPILEHEILNTPLNRDRVLWPSIWSAGYF